MSDKCLAFHGLAKNITEYWAHPKRGWDKKKKFLIDYSESLENYRQHLKIDSIPIFFHTYNSPQLSENQITEDLNPIDYLITTPIIEPEDKNKKKRTNSRINSINKVFSLIDPQKYDYILLTRFDLKFKEDVFSLINEPVEKITFGFHCQESAPNNYVDDNTIIVPVNKADIFLEMINSMEQKNLHPLGERVKNSGLEYNLLIPQKYHIWENPLYDIIKLEVEE